MVASAPAERPIAAWLHPAEPVMTDNGAQLQKLTEGERPANIVEILSSELREARFPPEVLVDYADVLGLTATEALIRSLLPTGYRIRRGYFGEVLAAGCLRDFEDCWVPIQKLRSMISSDQSLPGVDVVGARLAGGIVEAMVFVEAKVRTSRDVGVVLTAAQSLLEEHAAAFPTILHFVAVQLRQTNDPLYAPFLDYLQRRGQQDTDDAPYIYLLFEKGLWSDEMVSSLDDLEHLPPEFKVVVIEVEGLASLVESAYSSVGIGVDETDDE